MPVEGRSVRCRNVGSVGWTSAASVRASNVRNAIVVLIRAVPTPRPPSRSADAFSKALYGTSIGSPTPRPARPPRRLSFIFTLVRARGPVRRFHPKRRHKLYVTPSGGTACACTRRTFRARNGQNNPESQKISVKNDPKVRGNVRNVEKSRSCVKIWI